MAYGAEINSRRTAFPNVWLESIEVQKPPFDEKGVIQEFVGRGALKEFEPLQNADKITPNMLQNSLENIEESIGPLRDEFRVRYNMIVRTTPDIGSQIMPPEVLEFGDWLRERSVSTRSRLFVRAKNPFEPDVIEVGTPRKNKRLSEDQTADFWDVTVTVTK